MYRYFLRIHGLVLSECAFVSQPYIYKLHSFIMALTPTVHPVLFYDT